MGYSQDVERRLDVVIGRRMLNGCWFVTSVGIAIVQMRLIAQTWYLSHLAFAAACVVSAWLIGSLLSAILLSSRRLGAVRLWGVGLLACALLWLRFPLAGGPLAGNVAVGVCELAVLAFLAGLVSTAWLVQRRPWPLVGEKTALAKGTLCTMLGLGIVWLLPAWAGVVEIVCLVPLLVLDCWPEARCPLPTPGRVIDNWYDSYESADRWRLQLNRGKGLRGWWWSYLVRRERLPLILLASGISIGLGSIWSAVPTPFAGDLLLGHQIEVLGWLIASQLIALSVGLGCFALFRGMLGPPDRLIPEQRRRHAWTIAVIMLMLMACCLVALGLPLLQTPWYLATSLGIYTFAGSVWGILFPRLRPSLGTVVFSQRHLLLKPGSSQIGKGQLAYERAQEEYVNRLVFTVESLLTILLAPALGWLIDRWSVDGVLVAAGRFLLVFLVLSVTIIGLRQAIRYKRVQVVHSPIEQLPWEKPLEARLPEQSFFNDAGLVEEVRTQMNQRIL